MASGHVEIPDPKVTQRTRLANVNQPETWTFPWSPAQAMAIAMFNSQARGTLDDCLMLVNNALPYLSNMGYGIAKK